MIKNSIILICLLTCFSLEAQIGGLTNFEFLRLPSSARSTALGGILISIQDTDPSLALNNPAALDSTSHRLVSFNHDFNFANISNGTFAYAHNLDYQDLTAVFGIQYINYGTFSLTDEIGNIQGEFSSREAAINFGVSRQMNERIRLGVLLRYISSSLESYSASGIASDLGVFYSKPNSSSSIGLVIKNIGIQLSQFNTEEKDLPFDVQIAYSNRLQHLPFRFTIVGQRLDQWTIRYDDPDRQEVDILGETNEKSAFNKNIDNAFRHLIFNGEFLFGKNETVKIRLAYNHLMRQELSVSDFRSLSGFSMGFGIKIKRFSLDYGVGNYHLAGGTNHVGIRLDLASFSKKL